MIGYIKAKYLAEDFNSDPRKFCQQLRSRGVRFKRKGPDESIFRVEENQLDEILRNKYGKFVVRENPEMNFCDDEITLTVDDLYVNDQIKVLEEEKNSLEPSKKSGDNRGRRSAEIRRIIYQALKEEIPKHKNEPIGSLNCIWKKRNGKLEPCAAAMAKTLDNNRFTYPILKDEAYATGPENIKKIANQLIQEDPQFFSTLT